MVGIRVQLEWRAKAHPAVSGADVEDVPGVAVARIGGGINEANYMVVRGRLTPAHVPPVSGVIIHTGEIAGIGTVGACERGTGVGVGPGVAAVGRPVDEVVTIEVAVATILVHGSDVHVARYLVAGDLDVADERAVDRYRGVPTSAVITRVGDEERPGSRAPDIKIVPGKIHPPEKGRGWVIICPARFSVVLGVGVNAEMGPASRRGVPGSAGLVAAQALGAAAGIEPQGEPGAAWLVIQNNRVAFSTREGALTADVGEASERGAAVSGDRCAGDVNRDDVAAA